MQYWTCYKYYMKKIFFFIFITKNYLYKRLKKLQINHKKSSNLNI